MFTFSFTRGYRIAGVSLLMAAAAVLPGCGGESETPARQAITEVREVDSAARVAPPAMTAAERVGFKPKGAPDDHNHAHAGMPAAGAASTGLPKLEWETPVGWAEAASSAMRIANFTLPSVPGAECYLTVLPGDGGGVLANVNRWRGQMSLEPIDQAALDALPRKPMLGGEAVFTVLDGTFGGMRGDQKSENYRMLGAAIVVDGFSYFVKLTGPADAIASEEANFDIFVGSLRKAAAPAPVEAPAEAPTVELTKPSPESTAAAAAITWEGPATWTKAPDRMMRLVTYTVGSSECYVAQLGGDGGGLAMNLNRWRGQMGQPDLSEEEIAALPKITMMGKEATLIDITGEFTGMANEQIAAARMLGAVSILDGQAVFVKMTGPDAEVNAERDNFIAFCQSLK
jgi:hypothetical protein